jgi:hypothetical protein
MPACKNKVLRCCFTVRGLAFNCVAISWLLLHQQLQNLRSALSDFYFADIHHGLISHFRWTVPGRRMCRTRQKHCFRQIFPSLPE